MTTTIAQETRHHPADGCPPRPGAWQRWWDSRVGRQLLFELAMVVTGYYFYRWARHVSKDELELALNHTGHVIRIESVLGVYNEAEVQALALRSTGLIRAANWFYAHAHFWVTGTALVVGYMRWPVEYRRFRRGVISVTALALVIHVLYPLAPPRMFPEHGFVDTLDLFGPALYTDSALAGQANQIAAMPSLHFAYALLVTGLVVRTASSRLRWLAVLYPTAMLFVIVVTGNHFWLDAVVGGLLVLAVAPLTSPAERKASSALTPATT